MAAADLPATNVAAAADAAASTTAADVPTSATTTTKVTSASATHVATSAAMTTTPTMTTRENWRHGESADCGEEQQLFECRPEHGLPPFLMVTILRDRSRITP